MGELFDKDQFVELCAAVGYASKKAARAWCDANPKDKYTDEDFLAVYQSVTKPKRGGHKTGWREMKDGSRTTINNVNRGLAGNNRDDQDWR